MEEFQREAKAAADGPHMPSTAKLKQLIDQGQNLGVELSQCRPLKWVNYLDLPCYTVVSYRPLDPSEFTLPVEEMLEGMEVSETLRQQNPAVLN